MYRGRRATESDGLASLQASNFSLNIKFNNSRPFIIEVDRSWSCADLKSAISAKQNIPVDVINIIFAGQVIPNAAKIQNFDLSNKSIVHVILQKAKPTPVSDNEGSPEGELHNVPKCCQYFVYCKRCKSIQPGKLRVKCAKCGEGAFIVDKGPCGWKDVLNPGRINGSCQTDGCSGTVAEFYFKCSGHETISEDEHAVALHHVKPNKRQVACIACGDVFTPVLVFPCEDGHVICLDCFKRYGIVHLNDRGFVLKDDNLGYTLPCPAQCDGSYIEEIHHFRLLGDDQYARYQSFATEDCILQAGGVLCPAPGCGEGMLLDEHVTRVECTSCRHIFCRRCLNEFHDGECRPVPVESALGQEFPVDPDRAERARWEVDAKALIESSTKRCPSCHVRTERAGGCLHMTCRCGCNWCWQCEVEWTRECQANHWFG